MEQPFLKPDEPSSESSKISSKQDSQNQNNLAHLVQELQSKDKLKREIKKLLEDKEAKLEEEIKPFWRVYSSLKHNILYCAYSEEALKCIIDDFFTTSFHPNDLEETFKKIDKGLIAIKSSEIYSKIEEENNSPKEETENIIDEKTFIRYAIKTNTTIGKQFYEKFIEKIRAVVRGITPIKSTKEQIEELEEKIEASKNPKEQIEESNKENTTPQPETQGDDESKKNIKDLVDTINQSLAVLEKYFLDKLADLYIEHKEKK